MALAKWYKVDFHTHTPESRCFPDKGVSAETWVSKAKESGLNVVVVTDHNSVGFIESIDKIKNKYEDDNFKIFYGIELCVSAEYTHILIVFNNVLTVTQIQDAVISDLGLRRDSWADTEINVSETELKKLCNQMRDNIFIIPAHFGSEKGLGRANSNAIKKYQDFLRFDAIEVRNEHDVDEYNSKLANKVINDAVLITGSDNPSKRKQAEHGIDGFGECYTWMKMSSLTFEGLRQVFIDPEYRCINWLQLQELGENFDPNDVNYNYISGITLDGITHVSKNLSMRFSPYLNCIVGGRGTGKSTVVQAVKHGLSGDVELCKNGLFDKTFGSDGQINTYYEFGSNKSYKIETKREGRKLIHSCYDDHGQVVNPPEFQIDFYGQKEIFALIEDEKKVEDTDASPLVKMIDQRISTKLFGIKDQIESSLAELMRMGEEYRNNRRRIRELPTIRAEIGKAEAILQKYKDSGIVEARKKLEELSATINECMHETLLYNQFLIQLETDLKSRAEAIKEVIERLQDKNAGNVIEIMERIRDSYISIETVVFQQQIQNSEIENEVKMSTISTEFGKQTEVYLSALEQVKNTGSEDIGYIEEKLQDYRERETRLKDLQSRQGGLKDALRLEICNLLDKRLQLTKQRSQLIEQLGLDNLHICIHPVANKNRWKQVLQKAFGKEGVYDQEFENLVDAILVGDDFEKYKEFLFFLLTTESGDISEFIGGISDQRFYKVWEGKSKNGGLSPIVKMIPDDLVSISIIEESGEIDINEGSPGQKSAAILAFILSSGDNPLIIDQPEDDLDNSLIYNLVVKSIRRMKNRRQIIIVTHNPNIPVLGDAEGIIILERNSDGKVAFRKNKKAGCIEEKLIRNGICEIMEGGEGAFRKREEKYLSSNKR